MADQERGELRNERDAEADAGGGDAERDAALAVEPMGDDRGVGDRRLHAADETGNAEGCVDEDQRLRLHQPEIRDRECE